MIFTFVVLHYRTYKDTIDCIESIKKIEGRYNIIIVDNFSDNGSIEIISEKYKNDKKIVILKNDTNLGFAGGNNIGYRYAKSILNTDFVAVLNNDIIIEDAQIINKIYENYNKYKFHIAGPDIVSLVDNGHQNPKNGVSSSVIDVDFQIIRYSLLLKASQLNIYDYLKKKKINKTTDVDDKAYQKTLFNVKLHGAFVVFSPDFVRNEEYSFRPGTFLYMEEEILFTYCNNKKYKTMYIPQIRVFHKEDSSTNSIFLKEKEKREFVFENLINSLKIYRKELKNKWLIV